MGVSARVLHHLFRQRTQTPISELKPLVCLDTAVVVQQVRQTFARQLEHASGLTGVEQARDEHSEVFLKPLHVVIGAVHHFELISVRERLPERVAHVRAKRQDVDDEISLARAYLHQTRKSLKRPIRVMLEIDRELFALFQVRRELFQRIHRLHDLERVVFVHGRRQRRRSASENKFRILVAPLRERRERLVTLVPDRFPRTIVRDVFPTIIHRVFERFLRSRERGVVSRRSSPRRRRRRRAFVPVAVAVAVPVPSRLHHRRVARIAKPFLRCSPSVPWHCRPWSLRHINSAVTARRK